MTTPKEQPTSSIDQILADAKILRRKLKTKASESEDEITPIYILNQITENIIPLITATVEEVAEVDEVIQEVIEHEESYLQSDDAKQFLMTFALGDAMVSTMRDVLANIEDDLARKRHTELVDGFEQSLEVSKLAIASIIADSIGDDDDDDDDGDDDDNEKEKDDDSSSDDDGIERLEEPSTED